MDILSHNRAAWNSYVTNQNRWTLPVSDEVIENARKGDWKVVLTPTKAVPQEWFPSFSGLRILGLASGGGQQGPILAALGADVTIFDNSENQLAQDHSVSERHGLGIRTLQGDMRDLSVFADASFDLIFNPCSTSFVDDVLPVWKECFRVLRPGGVLMTGFHNPVTLQFEEDTLNFAYPQPFSDLQSLPKEKLEKLLADGEALIYGHTLTAQIGGQLQAGFMLTAMFEDGWGGTNVLDPWFPGFIATRAVKPA
jgi:ubiquinone/menaquinone biosynthesis C-methylase UbiE